MTIPGATTRGTKAGDIEDLMARMNIKEKVIQKASEVDRPEKAKLADAFKKFGKYAKVIAKPVVRAVSPFVPVLGTVGVGMGIADVAEAGKKRFNKRRTRYCIFGWPRCCRKLFLSLKRV